MYDFLFISEITYVLIHSCQTIRIMKPLWFIYPPTTTNLFKNIIRCTFHLWHGTAFDFFEKSNVSCMDLHWHLQTLCCISHLLIDIRKNDIVLCPILFSTNLIITDGGETKKVHLVVLLCKLQFSMSRWGAGFLQNRAAV